MKQQQNNMIPESFDTARVAQNNEVKKIVETQMYRRNQFQLERKRIISANYWIWVIWWISVFVVGIAGFAMGPAGWVGAALIIGLSFLITVVGSAILTLTACMIDVRNLAAEESQ